MELRKIVLCCDCPGVPQRAEAAARLLTHEYPVMYIGKNSICRIFDQLTGDMLEHAKALSRTKGKFAYYFEYALDGAIKLKYNLLTNKEVM